MEASPPAVVMTNSLRFIVSPLEEKSFGALDAGEIPSGTRRVIVDVFDLFFCQSVDLVSHRSEFNSGDFLILLC